MLEPTAPEPIAVVGMGCRFPGAGDPAAFWELLRDGRDAVREVPRDRWDVDAYYNPDPDAPGTMYTRSGGFLDAIDRFDAAFFGISPREAVSLDPQQRLLLEVSWEALEDAGLPAGDLMGSQTGVFVGIGSSDYLRLLGDLKAQEPYYGPGNAFSVAAGRLSYFLGLQGPCMAVDTACSSSLVAVHLACQSLRLRECDAALAGGVNAILTPETTIYFSRMRAMSADGRCKAFDAAADGYVRGEGCGAVVLKRLSDATAAGDRVLALIRGSAVNQDGRTSGLTAPNGLAQRAVLRAALANARVAPPAVRYVEAHGTGTRLGDPIEVQALAEVYCADRTTAAPLAIGSVKTNLGHLEAAAGMAGLIKTVLALRHGTIPPSLHFRQPNPECRWPASLEVPVQPLSWPEGAATRIAGVSAFGFSGTNAHLIVQEAPPPLPAPAAAGAPDRPLLLALSARQPRALFDLAGAYRDRLDLGLAGETAVSPADVCATAAGRRSHHDHRLAVLGTTTAEIGAGLDAFLAGERHPAVVSGRGRPGRAPRVVFVFSGQGGQWPGMGADLLHEPVFGEAVDAFDRAMRQHTDWRLRDYLAPDDDAWKARVDVVQPALCAFQIALARLWQSWGVVPAAVVGHSMGEVAAAHVAGALSLEAACAIVCTRSRLLRRVGGQGAMAVVDLPAAEALAAIGGFADRVVVASSNSPRSTVLSGEPAALDAILAELQGREVYCKPIKVDVASHSPQMDGVCATLEPLLAGVRPGRAHIPLHSTVTGALCRGPELTAAYWARNLRQCVQFARVVQDLASQHRAGQDRAGQGQLTFLEIGPHPVLSHAIEECLGGGQDGSPAVLPSVRRAESGRAVLLASLGVLYTMGQDVPWKAVLGGPSRVVSLPAYPWQRERFWVPAPAAPAVPTPVAAPVAAPAGTTPTTAPAGDNPVGEYYDRGAALHQSGAGGDAMTFDGYLTWGLFPRPRPGFSWLRTVMHPDRHPEDHRALVEGQEALRRILFGAVDAERLESVFDFGCGYGADLIALAERHPQLRLDGYTISARQAEIGNARAGRRGLAGRVRIYHRDSATQPFPGRYDLILGLEVAGLVEDKTALFGNVAAHLKDGGQLILADFIANTRSSIDIPETSTYASSAASWSDVLGQHRLRLVDIADVGDEIANCLTDPDFEAHLAAARAETNADPLLLRHMASYPNVERALRQGLLRYALFRAVKDGASTVAAIVAANNLAIAGVRSYVSPPPATSDAGANWLHKVEWRPAPPVRSDGATLHPARRSWLLCAESAGYGRALRAQLEAMGQTVVLAPAGGDVVAAGSAGEVAPPVEDVDEVVYLAALPAGVFDGRTLADAGRLGCAGLLGLCQAMLRWPPGRRRLWLVTGGTQGDALDQAPLTGLMRVIAHEHPELRPATIDLRDSSAATLEGLARELTGAPGERRARGDSALPRALPNEPGEAQVMLGGGRRLVARLEPLDGAGTVPYRPSASGSYLITGGLGGLGLEVAAWLAAQGAGQIYLAGRRAPTARAAERLAALAPSGAAVEVIQTDVRRPEEVAALFRRIDGGRHRLRGIVHAAGVLDDRTVLNLTPAQISAVAAPKVLGAWHLHVETARRDLRDLDFFVLFSGLASLFGSPGQGNYAAGNAFLDALAHYRRDLGFPALSVNWGPWQETGAVAAEGSRFALQGVRSLPTALGLDALARLIAGGQTQGVVAAFEWATWQRTYPALARSPLVSRLVPRPAPAAPAPEQLQGETPGAAPDGGIVPRLRRAAGWTRQTLLEGHLREQIAGVLHLSPAAVEREVAMKDLGFDSLMALQLRNRLEESLGTPLPVTMVWNYPNIPELAAFLAARLGLPLEASVANGAAETSGDAPADDLLDRIKELSEDEALHLLSSSISGISDVAPDVAPDVDVFSASSGEGTHEP